MKSKIAIAMLCMVAFLAFAGCASVDVTKTAKGYFAPTKAADVEILKTKPEKPYVELATVTVTNFAPGDIAKMHNAIRTKSAPLGADAVILTDEGIINNGWSVVRWATGVAIRFKGADE
jgi:hypothetical protein